MNESPEVHEAALEASKVAKTEAEEAAD